MERGYKADDFVGRLAFHLAAHKDFFEEIAKYRAARRIWYKLMKDQYEAKDPRNYGFRFHIQTAGSSLTAQTPQVNIIRTAIQALEATLGGCQSLHTNSYDEAICLPSEEAALIALRTQQVISDETRITNTIDPLAGSYYVEWLTDEIEERVWKYMDKIHKVGTIDKALSTGFLYKEMRDAFHRRQARLEKREEIMIGVNKYSVPYDECTDVFRTNKEAVRIEQERIRKLKERRDNAKLEKIAREDGAGAHDHHARIPGERPLELLACPADVGERDVGRREDPVLVVEPPVLFQPLVELLFGHAEAGIQHLHGLGT